MMEPTYVVEDGQYAFYLGGERRFVTPEVAILFDQDGDVLLKHGMPEIVQATFERTRLAFTGVLGLEHAAAGLTLIQGAFDVDELNKVVRISGYIGRFYQALQAQAAA